MKIKNEVFSNRMFLEAYAKLNKLNNLPIETFVDVLKINKVLQENEKIFNGTKKMLLEKYGKEEDGTWSIPDDAPQSVLKKVDDEFKELMDIEFTIDAPKLVLTKRFIGDRGLTPADVIALEPLIDSDSFVNGASVKKKKSTR